MVSARSRERAFAVEVFDDARLLVHEEHPQSSPPYARSS